MYRKHLKMARGEGEAPIRSSFVDRVVKLPMVHVVWDYASNTYTHIKESNRLVNFTLTNAERTATFVAGQAKPVVLKFEKQIQAVDTLACKGLGTLEEKVPFITKPADEIIGDTRKLYDNTVNSRIEGIKKYGNDTVKSAADFGLRQASAILGTRLVQTVLTSVDGILIVTHNYIDQALPPLKEEKQSNGIKKETDEEQPSGVVRMVRLSSTLRRRASRAFYQQLEFAQEKALHLVLIYPLRAIEFSKTHVDAAINFANQLWLAIRQQETNENDTSEKTRLEQQLLHLARLVSRQVAGTFSSINPPSLPTDSDSEEPSGARNGVHVVRDGALWIMGMVKLVPQLLPMYIYGLALWLEQVRGKNKSEDAIEMKQNGSSDHSDKVHNSAGEYRNGRCSDTPIPEENEDHQGH